jgi:ribosomal protein S27AE
MQFLVQFYMVFEGKVKKFCPKCGTNQL